MVKKVHKICNSNKGCLITLNLCTLQQEITENVRRFKIVMLELYRIANITRSEAVTTEINIYS
jgi:invasion protein IalB